MKTKVASNDVFIRRRRYLLARPSPVLLFGWNDNWYGGGICEVFFVPENLVTLPRPFRRMLGVSKPIYDASNALLWPTFESAFENRDGRIHWRKKIGVASSANLY